MTLSEMYDQIMFQTNNDADDLGDFTPHIGDYVNEGYDKLVEAYADEHVSADSETYPKLTVKGDEPNLPEYSHRGIVDYATYLIYRNGNAVKQNRGQAYYNSFYEYLVKLKYEGSLKKAGGKPFKFTNIYHD